MTVIYYVINIQIINIRRLILPGETELEKDGCVKSPVRLKILTIITLWNLKKYRSTSYSKEGGGYIFLRATRLNENSEFLSKQSCRDVDIHDQNSKRVNILGKGKENRGFLY